MKIQRGFTLMEVLVSLVLVGMLAAALTPSFGSQSKQNSNSEIKSAAINAAQRRVDSLRILDPATFPTYGSNTQNIQVGNYTFAVKTEYCLNNTYCTASTRHLKVSSSYKNKQYYETQTVFTQLR